MTTFVTRSQWGARKAIPGGNQFGAIYGTAVHWEAAPPPADHSKCAQAVRDVQNFHMNVRGWNDIAYNLVACDHDYLFEGRQGGTAANGTDYGNLHFPAVCWLGGPGHVPKDDALRAIVTARGKLGGDTRPIHPHNYFFPTACPGPFLTTWVKAGAKEPGKPAPPPPKPNFVAQYTGSGGVVHTDPLFLNELEEYGRKVIARTPKGDPPDVTVLTFYPDGIP